MFTSIGATAVLVILAIAALIVLSMKGWDIILCVFISTFILSLGYEGGIISAFLDLFSGAAGGYFGSVFILYLTSGVYAYYYMESGAAEAMGKGIMKKVSPRWAPYAILLASFLLGNAGVGSYMFILAPICFALFKAANLSLVLAFVPMVATCVVMVPGSTNVTNVVLSNIFEGSDLFTSIPLTIVRSVVGLVLIIIYIEWMLKHFKKKGIGYEENFVSQAAKVDIAEEDLPNMVISIIPIVLVLAAVVVLQGILKMDSTPTTILAEIIGTLFIVVTCRKQLKGKKHTELIAKGLRMTFEPLMMLVAVIGFATVISGLSVYTSVTDWIATIDMNPYWTMAIATIICAAVLADSVTGAMTAATTFGAKLIAQGANARALHSITLAASTTFDTMPHCVPVNICMKVLGLDHKTAYPYVVVSNIVIPLIYTVIITFVATLMY